MSLTQWALVVWIAINALIMFGRGCARQTRTYTMTDGILGILESALAVWAVTSL